jgi:hypothetical protein
LAKASWMKASWILPAQCDGCIRRQPIKTPRKRGFSLGMTGRSLAAAAAMGPAEEAWRAAANHDDRRPLDNHDGSVRTAAVIGAAVEPGAATTGDPNDIRVGRWVKRGRRHSGVCGAKADQRACKQRGPRKLSSCVVALFGRAGAALDNAMADQIWPSVGRKFAGGFLALRGAASHRGAVHFSARNPSISSLNFCGASRNTRWPTPGITSALASGIFAASALANSAFCPIFGRSASGALGLPGAL